MGSLAADDVLLQEYIMAVLTAGATSEGTFQGCRGSGLKSRGQALNALQFRMGFIGGLWGPLHSDSDCGVPCAMVANGARCNM
eukprot:365952-Chlamydomonas_euryale.AAC.9